MYVKFYWRKSFLELSISPPQSYNTHACMNCLLDHTKLISCFWSACGSIFSELLDLRNQYSARNHSVYTTCTQWLHCPSLGSLDTQVSTFCSSGVAKLGHTGARALATRGCAPPVQALLKIIGAECTVINHELGAKSAQRCRNRAAQYCYRYL